MRGGHTKSRVAVFFVVALLLMSQIGFAGKSTLFRTFLKRHQLKIALGTGSTILTG